jgi:putative transposase
VECWNLLPTRRFAVKRRFKEAQIIGILREAEQGERTIGDLCRDHGISEQTYYRWRQKYAGMGEPDLRRLRELERENLRLKRLVAERDLEIDVLREYLGKDV